MPAPDLWRTAARALLWEMETYTQRWNEHAIGITDIVVPAEVRRQLDSWRQRLSRD